MKEGMYTGEGSIGFEERGGEEGCYTCISHGCIGFEERGGEEGTYYVHLRG